MGGGVGRHRPALLRRGVTPVAAAPVRARSAARLRVGGMTGAQEGCIALLRDRLEPSAAAVALAAASPSTGAFSWSAGASPDGRPVTPRTSMYAGSITKQFLAALDGRTILAGRLEVDASV